MGLKICPVELRDANAFISMHHRHHKPVQGHRFSIGASLNETLVGVAVVGRPVARLTPASKVLEVTRLCTDGTSNACSFLYAAAARVGRELGYEKIQTFILLGEETGISLKACGWRSEGPAGGGTWVREGRPRRTDQPQVVKEKWSLDLVSR